MPTDLRADGALAIDPPLDQRHADAFNAHFALRFCAAGALEPGELDAASKERPADFASVAQGYPSLHCPLRIAPGGAALACASAPGSVEELELWLIKAMETISSACPEIRFSGSVHWLNAQDLSDFGSVCPSTIDDGRNFEWTVHATPGAKLTPALANLAKELEKCPSAEAAACPENPGPAGFSGLLRKAAEGLFGSGAPKASPKPKP